jgi:DNA-directed RNA polymerase subunit beta'
MTEDDFEAKRVEFGDEFVALMGAEGVKRLLAWTWMSRSRRSATT